MGTIRIGCSGWSYQHWRDPVYQSRPAPEWLPRYATMFPTVEVNSTFYRLPTLATVAGWADRSPPGFIFAVKVSRYLTHVRHLRDVREGGARLRARITPLAEAGKLGPLLWQLPETFRRDDERLATALRVMPAVRNCFEFRHPSWFCKTVRERLAEAGAALVFADHPHRSFQTFEPTADWVYLRFHYGSRGVRGGYSKDELEEWAHRIDDWSKRGDVYAYFNNDWEAFAVRDAHRLNRALQGTTRDPPSRTQRPHSGDAG
jgi:uncharacterized protein YecE (DUF72 family)